VSFCPPKSVGQITKGDLFDFYLVTEYLGNLSVELNRSFPSGIRILEVRAMDVSSRSLSSLINRVYYEITIPQEDVVNPVDTDRTDPVYTQTRSGMKDISESITAFAHDNGTLSCGLKIGAKKVTVYELLSYVTEKPVEEVKIYSVTRTNMFIEENGILHSPMEVK